MLSVDHSDSKLLTSFIVFLEVRKSSAGTLRVFLTSMIHTDRRPTESRRLINARENISIIYISYIVIQQEY